MSDGAAWLKLVERLMVKTAAMQHHTDTVRSNRMAITKTTPEPVTLDEWNRLTAKTAEDADVIG